MAARKPGPEEQLGEAGALEVGQVQTLVRAVRSGVRILDPRDEDLGLGKGRREGGHEVDRAADADLDRLDTPGIGERRSGRRVGRSGRRGLEGLHRLARRDLHVRTPRRAQHQVVDERRAGGVGVIRRTDPQRDLGPRTGDERQRRILHCGRVDADDGDRRTGPQPGGEVPASDQCHTLEHTRVCPQCGFGEVERVGCTGRQAVDGDVALVVVQSGQQPRQYRQGIGDRPAVEAAVDSVLQRRDFDHDIDATPQ